MSLSFGIPDGLVGGMLIGLSAGTLLLGNGNILGASGIVRSVVSCPIDIFTKSTNQCWKAHFLASFFVVSELYTRFVSRREYLITASEDSTVVSTIGYAVAGFLVGMGTKLGNGCTSGHGICGLARRSARSLAAVLTFMATGIAAATICTPDCYLAAFLRTTQDSLPQFYPNERSSTVGNIATLVLVVVSGLSLFQSKLAPSTNSKPATESGNGASASTSLLQSKSPPSPSSAKNSCVSLPTAVAVSWISGGLFSLGLAMSGMTQNKHIIGFLDLKGFGRGAWDPTLLFVMGGGLLVSSLSYEFVPGYNLLVQDSLQLSRPLSSKEKKDDAKTNHFSVPTNTTIDKRLLAGAGLFGVGWGIGGLCPGPAMFLAATGYPSVLYVWWPMFTLGAWVASNI
jgi:uncharacterized membrane protein YedE/YeeE